jgi:hypothetical protein
LENVIDIFKNVKGFYYDVPSKEEIKNIVKETPYQVDCLHKLIYQDCLFAYMFNKKTHEIKLDANEFVE